MPMPAAGSQSPAERLPSQTPVPSQLPIKDKALDSIEERFNAIKFKFNENTEPQPSQAKLKELKSEVLNLEKEVEREIINLKNKLISSDQAIAKLMDNNKDLISALNYKNQKEYIELSKIKYIGKFLADLKHKPSKKNQKKIESFSKEIEIINSSYNNDGEKLYNLMKNLTKKLNEYEEAAKPAATGQRPEPTNPTETITPPKETWTGRMKKTAGKVLNAISSSHNSTADSTLNPSQESSAPSAKNTRKSAATNTQKPDLAVSASGPEKSVNSLDQQPPDFATSEIGLRMAYNRIVGNRNLTGESLEGMSHYDGLNSVKHDVETFAQQKKDDPVTYPHLKEIARKLEYATTIAGRLDKVTPETINNPAIKKPTGAVEKFGSLLNAAFSEGPVEQDSFKTIVSDIHQDISKLKKGEEIIIPGGFFKKIQGKGEGHAVLYSIKRQDDGNFSFTIINTGDGAATHKGLWDQFEMFATDQSSDLQIDKINPSNLSDKFLEDLLGQMISNPSNSMDSVNAIIKDNLFIMNRRKPSNLSKGSTHDLQTHGTCAHSSVCSWVESALSKSAKNPEVLKAEFNLHLAKSGLQILESQGMKTRGGVLGAGMTNLQVNENGKLIDGNSTARKNKITGKITKVNGKAIVSRLIDIAKDEIGNRQKKLDKVTEKHG